MNYFIKHRKAHLDPEWAKRHLKHHFDHHMGREQDANWCVTQPWFDYLMGTRIQYEYDAQGKPIRDAVKPLDTVTLGGAIENTVSAVASASASKEKSAA